MVARRWSDTRDIPVESFVDELAANAKQDPLAYRVALLDKNPRAKAVLQLAGRSPGGANPCRQDRAAALRCASASAASSPRWFRSASTRMAPSTRRTYGAWSIVVSR